MVDCTILRVKRSGLPSPSTGKIRTDGVFEALGLLDLGRERDPAAAREAPKLNESFY